MRNRAAERAASELAKLSGYNIYASNTYSHFDPKYELPSQPSRLSLDDMSLNRSLLTSNYRRVINPWFLPKELLSKHFSELSSSLLIKPIISYQPPSTFGPTSLKEVTQSHELSAYNSKAEVAQGIYNLYIFTT